MKTNLPWYIHTSQEHLIHWDQQYPNIMQTVYNSTYCDLSVDASQNSMKICNIMFSLLLIVFMFIGTKINKPISECM